ncbi:MAG: T9SS type A sorting domain-containing protein [Crocinitomicaceae bacterium]|nr:T9SS type A sorting domain-containing protein [Crocinitomicaceae bacterium]
MSPNPGIDYLSLDLANFSELTYKILGMEGAIQQEGTRMSSSEHWFDISELAQGVYLLELVIDGKKGTKRFIKNK